MVKFRFKESTSEAPLKRIAFFILAHNDVDHLKRIITRLYSDYHYYIIHVDPNNDAYAALVNQFIGQPPYSNNVYLSRDVPIIYPASSATICLIRAMAWYMKYIKHWDYFVTLTGSDYPLIPLSRMEYILSYQNPPMPFLMVWEPQVSTHMNRLQYVSDVYKTDPELLAGFKANLWDRGEKC